MFLSEAALFSVLSFQRRQYCFIPVSFVLLSATISGCGFLSCLQFGILLVTGVLLGGLFVF